MRQAEDHKRPADGPAGRRPPQPVVGRLRFPAVELGAALVVTTGLLGWLLWSWNQENRANAAFVDHAVRVTELRGSITYLDEVLTMSARMAAATGDMRWKDRYDLFVPVLDREIAEAIQLSPPDVADTVDRTTRAANDALVGLETEAFAAAGQSDLTSAVGRLEGLEYSRHKQVYASGMRALSDGLQHRIGGQVRLLQQRVDDRMVAAAIATLVVAALWLNVAVTVDRWRTRTTRSEMRASRLAEAALEGILIHDERTIIDANRAFAQMVGADVNELVGETMLDLFPDDRRAEVAAAGDAGETDFIEATLLRRDGTLVPVELRSLPYDVDGRPARLTAIRDVSERKRAAEHIRRLAHYDSLTELPNRVLFWDRLGQALAQARRHKEQIAILCIDLDRFKEVNDTLGHAAGDKLLTQAARRLNASLRDSDTLARLGGDEFAVIMTNLREGHLASECAQRIVDALAASFDIDGNEVVIGASVGIALSDIGAENAPETILRSADLALYRAKADGRGSYRFFAEEMNARLQTRKAMERQLRQAMVEGQFELFYQPQVEAGSWRILGVEALLRWRHPERGLIMPAEFVPLAEETGLIIPLGEWVLRSACKAAKPWGDLRIAVNLSGTQFRQSGLDEIVGKALAEGGLEPGRLEVEVTETILLQDVEASLSTLQKIKKLGVRIAMDDFGTGYSSLSYLRTFPFDKIKIDRSFVQDLGRQDEASAIVRAVVHLGRSLGIRTSAEGVETRDQADILVLDGCDEVQGYHFGRPMSAVEIEAMLPQAGLPLQAPASSASAA
jgi:PAS domain S-box/diguanylate cyclase (GGDEF) domain